MKALMSRLWIVGAVVAVSLAMTLGPAPAQAQMPAPPAGPTETFDVSNEALLRELPGFESRYADVNGVRLHYVAGGAGPPLILLPGWPQTWWSYRKMMPELARHHRVIAVDIRGMGASSMPRDGYDKKTMARDIHELVRSLGYTEANILGHDIGAQVAFAYAANHPEATNRLILLDVPNPDAALMTWPLLPVHGPLGDKIDPAHAYAWRFAFHQVRGLAEDLLERRVALHHNWFFRYRLFDESAIDARDRAVYAAAYSSRDAIRSGNAWYQAFTQDIIDDGTYGQLQMPVLGLCGPGFEWLRATLATKASSLTVVHVEGSGHFNSEEKPEEATRFVLEFLRR